MRLAEEVAAAIRGSLGAEAEETLRGVNGSVHLDLWRANELILRRAGVRQVETAGLCTACHLDDWYSHRAEQGKTGRFGALVALKG